ncbi:hypothetical protein M5K25_014223 [Dendrobium thyrsiflorum]|uniref:Uncharacterized protein n=1 Tax=Dendrobium thyrsiflorum TaxID=117978 RepID=A0ABD0UVI6_DENTH
MPPPSQIRRRALRAKFLCSFGGTILLCLLGSYSDDQWRNLNSFRLPQRSYEHIPSPPRCCLTKMGYTKACADYGRDPMFWFRT